MFILFNQLTIKFHLDLCLFHVYDRCHECVYSATDEVLDGLQSLYEKHQSDYTVSRIVFARLCHLFFMFCALNIRSQCGELGTATRDYFL